MWCKHQFLNNNTGLQKNKTTQLLIPPFLGVIPALLIQILSVEIVNTLIYPGNGDDDVIVFSVWEIFLFTFPVLYLAAIVIQYFIAIPVWKIYTDQRKFLKLTIWQLILFSSILFGISTGYYYWYSFQPVSMLIYYAFCLTAISISYWSANLFTMRYLDRKRAGSDLS